MNSKLVKAVAIDIHTLVARQGLTNLEKYVLYRSLYDTNLKFMKMKGYNAEDVMREKNGRHEIL